MNHVGLTHVGINAGMVPNVHPIKCRAVLRAVEHKCVVVNGFVIIRKLLQSIVYGTLYSPNRMIGYKITGMMALLSKVYYLCIGKHETEMSALFFVKSTLQAVKRLRFSTTAVLIGGRAIAYECSALIMSRLKHGFDVQATLHGYEATGYKVFARLKPSIRCIYTVKSCIGNAKSMAIKVTATISTMKNITAVVKGTIENTYGQWFYTVKGMNGALAFVASVPRKMQQFLTNKRWFKNG